MISWQTVPIISKLQMIAISAILFVSKLNQITIQKQTDKCEYNSAHSSIWQLVKMMATAHHTIS